MEKFLRQHGLYVLMLLGIVGMQCFLTYGGALQEEGSGAGQLVITQRLADHVSSAKISPILFFTMAGVILVFGVGLVLDTVFFMRWMLARSVGRPFFNAGSSQASPWETEDVARLFVIFFFALSCIHVFLIFFSLERASLFMTSAGVYAVVLLTLFVWLKRKNAGFPRIAGWADIRKGVSTYFAFVPLLAVLLFMSLTVCQAMGIEAQPHELVNILRAERDPLRLIFLGLLSVFVGPVMEEIIFRWVTYGALRKKMGVVGAACGSATLFAMAHTNAAQMLPVFGMGLMLALLYEHTGSLGASMVFHMLNNVLALILTLAVVYGVGGV